MRTVAYFLERAASLDEAAFVAELQDYVLVQVDATEAGVGQAGAEITAQIGPGVLRNQAKSSSETAVFALPQGPPLVIGRSSSCSIQVLHSSVSKQHAEFSWRGEALSVTDKGSTNGTFVNRAQLEAKATQELKPDDTVRFGQGDTYLVMTPKAFYHYLLMLRRFGI